MRLFQRRKPFTGKIPQNGDNETRQRFLWRWTRIGNELIRWMWVVELWGYYETLYPEIQNGKKVNDYPVGQWVKLSEKVI